MAKKGGKATKAEREAGARNLAKWKEKNPSGGNLKHGAYSREVRRRFRDKRTTEGRNLQKTISALIEDIGGSELTPAQKQIICRIAKKLVILNPLGDYIEAQADRIIDEQGSPIPCLNVHLRCFASLLRDLDLLYKKI
jgi:hypothetical protein